jgi:hypothetical protein
MRGQSLIWMPKVNDGLASYLTATVTVTVMMTLLLFNKSNT